MTQWPNDSMKKSLAPQAPHGVCYSRFYGLEAQGYQCRCQHAAAAKGKYPPADGGAVGKSSIHFCMAYQANGVTSTNASTMSHISSVDSKVTICATDAPKNLTHALFSLCVGWWCKWLAPTTQAN
jgi:hypothetical protein